MAFIESIRKMLMLRGKLDSDEFIMFHGTSRAAWLDIAENGFRRSHHETSALGEGVYLTKSAFKAMDFARKDEGRMIVVRVKLGRMYRVRSPNDPNIKKWQKGGYHSAWAEGGEDVFRRHEVCVADPNRISIIEAKKPFTNESFTTKDIMLFTYERIANALNSTIPDLASFSEYDIPLDDTQIVQKHIVSLPPPDKRLFGNRQKVRQALANRPLSRFLLQQEERKQLRRTHGQQFSSRKRETQEEEGTIVQQRTIRQTDLKETSSVVSFFIVSPIFFIFYLLIIHVLR
mmetsp:Transcript_6960/g.10372  ORF Transcript_6960/g.10372 Transcript_6960/m.10372 type:complete len:288 (+) Transcript_6960:61-924(+)